ncbi:hypothetical protein HAPAU_33840 [Halalkalicoccus paucihalophilus]|uniref:Uncharacterized protein n=1 Tax=Halalkalicoccus paucihalophilus TaxID=1008153 RepID=A0A151A9P2_9EURY|nr:hypothetical protein [Halalkalicoccus paucihalophilus]KYH24401.1 hypothetical protein HAPAU_33840 [Halalkalicoccus paucihalophilus]
MDLSEVTQDGDSGEVIHVDGRDQQHWLAPTRCASSASDYRTAIHPAQSSNHEPLEQCYDGFLEFDESEEGDERQAMNDAISSEEAMPIPNYTSNTGSKLTETNIVEATTVDESWKGCEIACRTGRAD